MHRHVLFGVVRRSTRRCEVSEFLINSHDKQSLDIEMVAFQCNVTKSTKQ
jgi:hypothetical protein